MVEYHDGYCDLCGERSTHIHPPTEGEVDGLCPRCHEEYGPKTCNECGQPASYWDKGWDDELWGGESDSFWCEEHKHFKPSAEPIHKTVKEQSHEPPR